MSRIAVVYWSGTGNTEIMANKVAEGARSAGAEVDLLPPSEFNSSKVSEYDAIAFGCPAMGAEVLEESEFQPMWDDVKSNISGKNIGLFGSYGWGSGEWMDLWADEARDSGASLVGEGIMANYEPDASVAAACEALGKALI